MISVITPKINNFHLKPSGTDGFYTDSGVSFAEMGATLGHRRTT